MLSRNIVKSDDYLHTQEDEHWHSVHLQSVPHLQPGYTKTKLVKLSSI